jgi:hypothetical protein
MKDKVRNGTEIIPHPAVELEDAVRFMDRAQSGLRQVLFTISALIPNTQRTPEVDARLADMHQDEARFHEREAECLRAKHLPLFSSASGGVLEVKPSPGRSSRSAKAKKSASSSRSVAPAR